jgi:membrane dipeptidase
MRVPGGEDERALVARAAALHRDALVWDNHGCLPLESAELLDQYLPQLERYRDAGTDVVMINIGFGEMTLGEHVERLARLRRWVRARPELFVEALTVDAVRRARVEGKLAIGYDIEGMAPIEDELALISLFYDLGVRWMLVAYNRTNRIGGGCHDQDPGLTERGREALDEMARVGMVVCCSHTGYRTTLDVMRYSKNPVILSHSNPRALKDHPRNVPDALLEACAATGGVVGINGIGIFLGDNDTSTEAFARHVDYVARRVGVEHVGIGMDYVFDQEGLDQDLQKYRLTFPDGWGYDPGIRTKPPEELPEVTAALLAHGYSDDDVRAILGGNLLRVAERVWR